MKTKLITLALAFIAIMATSCGSSKNTTQSQIEDDITKQIKIWEADGYRRSGTSVTYSLEKLMANHRAKIEAAPNKYTEFSGIASGSANSSLSALSNMAVYAAARDYAAKANMTMKGKMGSHYNSLSEDVKDQISANYIAEIGSNIMPYLNESFAIEKITATSMEIRIYFLIDEEKATKVREDAANTAIKNSLGNVVAGQALLKNIDEAVSVNPISN